MQGGADYKKLRRQQFASQLRFFRQLCTAAKVPLRVAVHMWQLPWFRDGGTVDKDADGPPSPQNAVAVQVCRLCAACRCPTWRSLPKRRWRTQRKSSAL